MSFLKSSLCSEPVALAWHRRQERKEKPYFTKILRIGSAKTAVTNYRKGEKSNDTRREDIDRQNYLSNRTRAIWEIEYFPLLAGFRNNSVLKAASKAFQREWEREGEEIWYQNREARKWSKIYEMKNIVIELIPPTIGEDFQKEKKRKMGEFFLVLPTDNKTLSPSKNQPKEFLIKILEKCR